MAFSFCYPQESASGAQVEHRGVLLQMFNAIGEANLMCIRKTAEFFKPRAPSDRDDTLHSYQFPGYTNQVWIVPRETYLQFHKRVGHLTLEQVRTGNVSWPVFDLTMQALNQWVDFFRAEKIAYAADADTSAYCARCEEVLRSHSVKVEREALDARRTAAAAAEIPPRAQTRPGAIIEAAEGPTVHGAVLLIGSLLWEGDQPKLDGAKGELRKKWREERLDAVAPKNVHVKICYARISDSRAGQYTMCLGGSRVGTAKINRLKGPMPVVSLAGFLRAEADALAKAEGIRNDSNPFNSAGWGLVAIAVNPHSPHQEAIRAAWIAQFDPSRRFQAEVFGEGVVDQGGILLVDLPWRGVALRRIDFCLATPTAPNDRSPTPAKIAKAAKAGLYFERTRRAGIRTGDDARIAACLRR